MEEKKDWNIASNAELKDECKKLENIFEKKQEELKKHVESIEILNDEMKVLSQNYIDIKQILNKRTGKTDIL